MRQVRFLGLLLVGGWLLTSAVTTGAPPTPAQRKELANLSGEIRKVPTLISRKKTDEAQEALDEIEAELAKLLGAAEFPDGDRQVATLQRTIELQKASLAKATGGKGGAAAPAVSFVKDVAPILADKCGNCHSADRASGGLQLETFAGMERGGRSGPLVIAGNPNASALMLRVASPNPMTRMPRNGEPLTREEMTKIAAWIAAGATFDGTEKNVSLSLLKANPMLATEKIEIPKPTGNETVSFVRDIAPTFVTTCGGCHGGNNPRGGFSLANFERLMAGGESGKVIVPTKPDESRLWRLVNADDTPVMPQGNMARITRKWHADLRTWITEGAKFDGNDPKRPLSELIPSPGQLKAEELAKLTPDGWIEKRLKDSQALWKRTFPQSGEPGVHQTKEFIVLGDVAPRRLEEVGTWAEEHVTSLRSMFNDKAAPLFKGKLAIFVFRERFGYEEFNNTIHGRQVPREVVGHSDVTMAQDQAFAAVLDVGDDASPSSPGLQLNVVDQVTGAYLKREGGNLPDWLARGTGLAIAAGKSGTSHPYISALNGQAVAALQKAGLQNPADVFNNGQFSPADVGPIGYSLVGFLLKQGGGSGFGQLVRRFQAGDQPAAAIQSAYRTDSRQLGTAFLQSVGSGRNR